MLATLRRVAVLIVVSCLALPVPAQAAPPPCAQDAGPAGCVDLTLSPATLTGDVFVDGAPVAGRVNAARLSVVPAVAHVIEVKNIADTTPGFGDLFVYAVISQTNVIVQQGRVQNLTLKPRINYLKGIVRLTCDVKGLQEGQNVACQPAVDGAPVAAVNPGATADLAILVGKHTLNVTLVGADAGLWAPPASDYPVEAVGNRPASVRATFNRKGQLVISLNPAGIVADFFVDGQPVAGQAASAAAYVAPGAHTVEARNIADPAANGVYRYADVSAPAPVAANQSRPVVLRPAKQFLLGFAQVTCRINGIEAGQDVRCTMALDGQGAGVLENGANQTYNLAPGPHTVGVAVAGASAALWAPANQDLPANIVAGRNSPLVATFNRRGIVNITLSDPNVVADIYLDGAVIAQQAATAQAVVDPNVNHKIEGRALHNKISPDAFEYDDISSAVTVGPNQTRALALKVGRPREKCVASMALFSILNHLRAQLTLRISGPESIVVRVPAGQSEAICLLPGAYTIVESAPGYITETDTSDLSTGGCHYFKFWDTDEEKPGGTCSTNVADYHRP
jgi:hypothetical protein